MLKAKIIDIDIQATIDWECPVCKMTQHTVYSMSAFRSMDEDPIDEQCQNCMEFVTLAVK